jgi:hypothetical protein
MGQRSRVALLLLVVAVEMLAVSARVVEVAVRVKVAKSAPLTRPKKTLYRVSAPERSALS